MKNLKAHGDGSGEHGEHSYAANIITFFRVSKFSVEKNAHRNRPSDPSKVPTISFVLMTFMDNLLC